MLTEPRATSHDAGRYVKVGHLAYGVAMAFALAAGRNGLTPQLQREIRRP